MRFAAKGESSYTLNESHKLLGSSIINYIGLYLLLSAVCDVPLLFVLAHVLPQVHGKISLRCNLASFLFLGAVATNIIGIIILWNLSAVTHVNSALDGSRARNTVFNQIAVPQTASMFMAQGGLNSVS